MPFNGSGVFQRVRNWVADATAGIKIRADYHDAEDDGFATGLSNCITKDGQTIVTQNIPMSNKRITGLADPVNPQDAATNAQINQINLSLQTLVDQIVLKVSKAGDGMTGDLVLPSNAVTALRFQLWSNINQFYIGTDGAADNNSLALHGGTGNGYFGFRFMNGPNTADWATLGPSGLHVAGNVVSAGRSGDINLTEALQDALDRIAALESRVP